MSHDRPQVNRYSKLDDRGEAHLIALVCRDDQAGHDHWTLRLLTDQAVEFGLAESLSHFCEPMAGWRHVAITQRRTISVTLSL